MMRMPRAAAPLVLTAGVALLSAAPAAAQDRPWTLPEDPTILAGFLAWDQGDYPTALRSYLEALDASATPERLREIAALTGEVYTTMEVARDGGDLQMGPTGRYMTFTVEEGEAEVTKVVAVATGLVVATVPATTTALSPGGQIAYLVAGTGEEIERTRETLGGLMRDAPDPETRRGARDRLRMSEARAATLRVLDLQTGAETSPELAGPVIAVGWGNDGVADVLLAVGEAEGDQGGVIWNASTGQALTTPRGYPAGVQALGDGRVLVRMSADAVVPGLAARPVQGQDGYAVLSLRGEAPLVLGDVDDLTVSADGSRATMLTRGEDGSTRIEVRDLTASGANRPLFETGNPITSPVISPDGRTVAFQMREIDDWDIYAIAVEGTEPVQITTDIQHDRDPMWVGDRILSAKGEGRHQRSYLNRVADVAERVPPLKLHHNNSIRTIAPEYDWIATPDGTTVFLVSERDGDTVSPERGVYRVDLTRPVTESELRDRIAIALTAETGLRARGEAAFDPMADRITEATEQISTERIYAYAADLYRFNSKNITQPGNRLAIDYLVETLERWGYEPILEWWEPRPGIRTTNVVVRIEGSENPELVYVVSSHFDSSARGPGADDNSSGSTALLEVARVLAGEQLPATIELAWFTGEESGLLGSRYYVQRAQETGKRIVGALNNDMVGWANDHRLDNTIRYSNPGIRDIQHAAAMMFSNLITYDALYYKSTDAAAYYDAYGDIVGGIGSYPVLANPHYHQFTDRLETINQQLVAEVAKTTAATIMLLAASPSRLGAVEAVRSGDATTVTWPASPEHGVMSYTVAWLGDDGMPQEAEIEDGGTSLISARLPGLPAGATVSVRATHESGTVGWDWARVVVGG